MSFNRNLKTILTALFLVLCLSLQPNQLLSKDKDKEDDAFSKFDPVITAFMQDESEVKR